MKRFGIPAVLFSVIALAATLIYVFYLNTINSKSVILTGDRNPGQFLATDSTLRLIINQDISAGSGMGLVEPLRIICTEPSPDVVSSIANSFGGSASIFGRGDATLTAEQIKGLVQLGERTATIQLLRDKMYQTCLAYANGAISAASYSLIMSRLDDTIVTLLMGETAGGIIERSLVALGGSAAAEARASLSGLPDAAANLQDRVDTLANDEQNVGEAEQALTEHRAIPEESRLSSHDARDEDLRAELDEATARRDIAQRLLKGITGASGEIPQGGEQVMGGTREALPPDSQIGATLRDMHAEFLSEDVAKAFVFACIVELGSNINRADISFDRIVDQVLSVSYDTRLVAVRKLLGSKLGALCDRFLPEIIIGASERRHLLRLRKADIRAAIDEKRCSAQYAAAAAWANKTLTEAITACNAVADTELKNACLKKAFDLPD